MLTTNLLHSLVISMSLLISNFVGMMVGNRMNDLMEASYRQRRQQRQQEQDAGHRTEYSSSDRKKQVSSSRDDAVVSKYTVMLGLLAIIAGSLVVWILSLFAIKAFILGKNQLELLGFDRCSSHSDIRTSFRQFTRDNHPDTSDKSPQAFAELNSRFKLFLNEHRRSLYNRRNSTAENNPATILYFLSTVLKYSRHLIHTLMTIPNLPLYSNRAITLFVIISCLLLEIYVASTSSFPAGLPLLCSFTAYELLQALRFSMAVPVFLFIFIQRAGVRWSRPFIYKISKIQPPAIKLLEHLRDRDRAYFHYYDSHLNFLQTYFAHINKICDVRTSSSRATDGSRSDGDIQLQDVWKIGVSTLGYNLLFELLYNFFAFP